MKRELILAVIAAASLAACGPDAGSESASPKASAAPAQSTEAAKPAEAAAPAASETNVASTGKPEGATPAAGDARDGEKKEDTEKKPQ